MAYTKQQELRKMRARNKGSNKRIAASLTRLAERLNRKGPEEFSPAERLAIKRVRDMLTQRLYADALTEAMQDIINGKIKTTYVY